MNAHFLLVAALVAVAAARPQDFHDDVFHFSSKVNAENLPRTTVVSQQSVPVLAKAVVVKTAAVPQYQQYQQVVKTTVPQYQQYHQIVEQQAPVLFRTVEQEVPAVHAVHTTHHVHQPVFSQVSAVQQVAPSVVTSRSSFVPQQYTAQYNSQYSSAEPKFRILKHIQEFDPVGIYHVNFETENGIISAEQGTVKDVQAKEGPVAAKEGSYSYTGPDGVQYSVNWVADEFGYRASGAHLPVAPEIPEEIKRSLELIASQPQKYDEDGNPLGKQF